jgi:hypothetical protein
MDQLSEEKEKSLRPFIYAQVHQAVMNSVILQGPIERERGEELTVKATKEIMEKIKELLKEEQQEKLTVTLGNSDIVAITERMHRDWPNPSHGHAPSQGFLEYKFCALIKEIKGVDFFEEERRIMEAEEKERIARGGTKDGENEG